MKPATSLKVIHRNRLFRECLAAALSEIEEFQVAEVDHTEADYLESIEKAPPDVVLVDASLPQQLAVDLTQHVRNCDQVKVIVLASRGAQENLVECAAAGAQGCVLEDSSLEDLQAAIKKVCGGEIAYSPELVHSMFTTLAESARQSPTRQAADSVDLTPRELEIVELIAERLSNKEIARRLHLSIYTVKNHVHNVVEKLRVEDRFEAVEYARGRRWLKSGKIIGSMGRRG